MTDTITAISVIGAIAGKVIDALVGKGVEKTLDISLQKLQGNVTQKVFESALAEAIHRYSTYGNRYSLAEPLLNENSPLANESVVKELCKILTFDQEPDYQYIGGRWKSSVPNPPNWRDFTLETKLLIGFLQSELQTTEVFGPVFDSKNLSAININIDLSKKTLQSIDHNISNLISLMDSKFGELTKHFSNTTSSIHNNIRDFSQYIEEKSDGFVGRKFVIEKIEKFFRDNPRGYFIIKGDPGIGKTALAAQYVKQNGCVHHFNNRSVGVNRADLFLKNICSQLIASYQLNYSELPPEATQDSQFLSHILNQISQTLKPGEKIILIIDALDEIDDAESLHGANLLYLPPMLPRGVYIICTSRKIDLRLRIDCEQIILTIDQDGQENLSDIFTYINGKLELKGIQDYINLQSLTNDGFLKHMTSKSQGNFMYLRYVIPEIENGYYKNLDFNQLPEGLKNYYEDHWRRMKFQSENDWFDFKLPIVIVLSVVKEPVSLELISKFSKVSDFRRIRSVLNEWKQFLYERRIVYESEIIKQWRVYHDSFREFIASKDEVDGEHVVLRVTHEIIADVLWQDLFDN